MAGISDHPLRYALANELHARPFPVVEVPSYAILLAVKQPVDAVGRDRRKDRAHLLDLLDRNGCAHPAPDATHHFTDLGRGALKWESHTEFVTYTAFQPGRTDRPFDPAVFDVFPADWLAKAPGTRITSVLVRIEEMPEDRGEIRDLLNDWFVAESLACSEVVDGSAIVASDFRIDSAGHMRFAVFVKPGTGQRRVGRIVQRLLEVETYKSMSMLGLARVRLLSSRMTELDTRLSTLVADLGAESQDSEDTLKGLLSISAELETMVVRSSFRFGATGAYEAIVHQRIEVLREERLDGRQTFHEFMMRRYDPAMRTVKAAERRLEALADRAMRAGTLLSTRVDVERSAQNQKLLESMDSRAGLQLRLQRTVEGLSVVAISYYGVGLANNIAVPIAEPFGLSSGLVTALLTPAVVLVVWLIVRRIRQHLT